MEILTTLRCLAEIPLTFFSKLLNITVHTYVAYEQGKMIPPPEIIVMIALLYNVNTELINSPSAVIDSSLADSLKEFAKKSNEEKFKQLSYRILGNESVPNYRSIRSIKNKIKETLRQ